MSALLELQNVHKRYGDFVAVDDVSVSIEPGEIFALLGPNGAGKTTLIGCITGLNTGFGGRIRVAGYDVARDYRITRRLVGLVPQELNYDAFFTVRELLAIQAGYFGVRPDDPRIDELLESFALADKADANTRWLSGGMKRRLMICKALVHDPVLLFLDEPTAGVDVELREELWEYVERLRDRGTTIVLTTHYIEEAEQLADRIGILNRGQLGRVASRDELMREFGDATLEVEVDAPIPASLISQWRGSLDVELVDPTTARLRYGAGGKDETHALIASLISAGLQLQRVDSKRSSLEEVFRTLVRRQRGGLDGDE